TIFRLMVLNSVTPAKAGVHDQSVENPAKQDDLNARKNPAKSVRKTAHQYSVVHDFTCSGQ
ncbi:MAG: hypothetical protein LW731_11160, partial [Oxalobacteraceae bacterium]|nr:hypothetical protein [Oxalobacteraceae bacterium]